jgi:hypothetical protein
MLFRRVRDPDNPHRVPPPRKKLAHPVAKALRPPRDVALLLPDLLSVKAALVGDRGLAGRRPRWRCCIYGTPRL